MAERERRRRSRRDGGRTFRLLSSQGKDEDWIAELREQFPDGAPPGRSPGDVGAALCDAEADSGAAPPVARPDTPGPDPPPASGRAAGPGPAAGPDPPAASGSKAGAGSIARAARAAPATGPGPTAGSEGAAGSGSAARGAPTAASGAAADPGSRTRAVPAAEVEAPVVVERPPVAEPPEVVVPPAVAVPVTGDPVASGADDPWQVFADVLDAQQSTLVALAERLDEVEARLADANRRPPPAAPHRAAGPRPDAPTMREVVDALRASALGSAARLGREVTRRRR